jgi:hypothetical protein
VAPAALVGRRKSRYYILVFSRESLVRWSISTLVVDAAQSFFQGGIGGPGGYADNEGGHGGVGEANIFPSLISPIDDETRRQIQPMPLENLEISTKLCERLKDHGFRTVGGLFEAYEQDVQQPGFKPGNLADLKAVLRKVAAQCRV